MKNKDLLCSIEDCENEAFSRGWCKKHYQRWYNWGDPLKHKTHQSNVFQASKTHCPYNHEYTPENTYVDPKGSRQCRTCGSVKRTMRYLPKGTDIHKVRKLIEEGLKTGCEICGKQNYEYGRKERLHVDHDHATGIVRGMLCNNCNHMLGLAKDSVEHLQAAINYLQK